MSANAAKNIFAPYKKPDESLEPYIYSFKLMMINDEGSIVENIKDTLTMIKGVEDESNDSTLKFFMKGATQWLKNFCREHVNVLDGRVRFHLQSFFDETILVNSGYNLNFTMRENEGVILSELLLIIELSWKLELRGKCNDAISKAISHVKEDIRKVENYHHGIVTDRAVEDLIQGLVIQRYLHTIAIEKQANAYSLLMGHHITMCRLFKLKRDNTDENGIRRSCIEMRSCGEFGSTMALHIHIYRLAAASLIACTNSTSWQLILDEVKDSTLCHIIAPMINKVKQMNNEKIDVRKKVLKENGDIVIDEFEFAFSKWSRLIPSLIEKFESIFDRIFTTSQWKQMVDLQNEINVTMIRNTDDNISQEDLLHYDFYVNINGKLIKEEELQFHKEIPVETFEKLNGLVMISLHGIGLGATRISELFRLQQHQIYWKGGNFYYLTISNKRKSSNTNNKRTITHKLPAGISRFLLLYDYVGREFACGREHFLFEKGKTSIESGYDNKEIYSQFADIFELGTKCSCLVMRHLYTSICNFLFPGIPINFDRGIVTTAGNVAEMSGHSSETHEQYYSSSFSKEGFFNKYHYNLGAEVIFDQEHSTPLGLATESDVLHCLKVLFGLQAQFLSKLQQQMVLDACNNLSKHTFCSIGCGGGKSLSWVIPTIRNLLKQVSIKMSLVVVPYCFLLEHHVSSCRDLIGTCRRNIEIGALKGSDIDDNILPNILRDKESLPAILFVSLEAIRKLVEYHHLYLTELGNENYLQKIYIDESHTILLEINFRPSYEALSKLATLNVPIALFSGTFQRSFVNMFLKYLFGAENNRMYNFIVDDSIFGDTLMRIEHSSSDDYLSKCCAETKKYVTTYKSMNVHIIVSTKDEGVKIEEVLKSKGINCEFIFSGSKNQSEVATKWNNNLLKILITTTLGIVGNESSKTGLVCIVGLHYNLPSIVQAYGRIRFKQRTKYSKCSIFTAANNNGNLHRAKTEDPIKLDNLIGMGIVSEKNREKYKKSMTVQSVHEWLYKDQGCRLVSLAHRLGFRQQKCTICDMCTNSCVRIAAKTTRKNLVIDRTRKDAGLQLLRRLKMKCICCNKSECNGSCVASKRKTITCFHCLGPHYASRCSKSYQNILKGKACFSCWVYNYSDECIHDHSVCSADGGIKERFRALIQYDYLEKRKKSNMSMTFNVHLAGIFASEASFFRFLHKYNDWK